MLACLQVDSVAGVCGAGTGIKSDIDDKSVEAAVCIFFLDFYAFSMQQHAEHILAICGLFFCGFCGLFFCLSVSPCVEMATHIM